MKVQAAIVLVTVCFMALPAVGQQDDSGADNLNAPASMRCSSLAGLEQAEQTTTIFYIAGYYDGQRDATTIATVGQSDETAGQVTSTDEEGSEGENGAAISTAGPEPSTSVPELALEAILAGCAQSPDSRIADVITAHLGSRAE